MPLVARHSDLVLIGRFLIVKPVHHIMRGAFVDRSSDKRSFEPHIVTYPLVPLRKNDSLGWNPVWLYDQSVGMWDVTKPDTITAMRHHIEAIALPPLRAIKTFDDYIAHERAKSTTFYGHFDDRVFTNIFVAAALGDFSKALQLRPQDDRIERYFAKFAPDFFPALEAGDRQFIAKALHQWEEATVKAQDGTHLGAHALPTGAVSTFNVCGELPYQFKSIWILRGGRGMSQA
jgi:hypothetical protein